MNVGGRIGAMLEWLHPRPAQMPPTSPFDDAAEAAAKKLRETDLSVEREAMRALAADGHLMTVNSKIQAMLGSLMDEVSGRRSLADELAPRKQGYEL